MIELIEFLNLAQVNRPIESQLSKALLRVIERGDFILGPESSGFEQSFANYIGVKHAIGTGSGLDALTLIISALNLPSGSEIIVPANTYIATILAILHNQCVPILVEPCVETHNIDVTHLSDFLSDRTRAVIAVHLYGQISDWTAIEEFTDRHGLILIEDAAQAHGASTAGRKAGALGDAAAFSFYPTKNLGALGDGGMVTTDDDALAQRVRALRNYGKGDSGVSESIGWNSRLDELQAAVLQVKLPYLDAWNNRRRAIARIYQQRITHPLVQLPKAVEPNAHVWHQFVIRTEQRARLASHLRDNGIGTAIHYPVPAHRQPVLRDRSNGTLPITERLSDQILSLPMNTSLTDEQVISIAEAINTWPTIT
ncbi:MAG: DegT/DnrJ/EryC1/StrS family aminotransferase [Coriobacteriaceae bacterium]|nr:DegT/DnrJ/EryC1/StrS family aminotransferase [Coriobacteriaceae bacterium]